MATKECHTSLVIVPFAVDSTESTPFTKGSHGSRLRIYYRSSVATFGTIRRFNPSLKCIFATNTAPPRWVTKQFERLDVQIKLVEARSIQLLPLGTIFRTSLYLFDVLRAIDIPEGKAAAFLDPDVLCVGSFKFVLEDGQVGYLPLETGAHDSIKGLTLTEIAGIRDPMGYAKGCVLRHVGGEVLVVTPGALPALFERIDEGLSCLQNRSSSGFLTEEHVLTYASDQNWRSMRLLVARIWTSPRYRDVPEDALNLALWHLPAEKIRGLQRAYRGVSCQSLDHFSDDVTRRLLGRWVGVIPTRRRALSDRVRNIIMWLTATCG